MNIVQGNLIELALKDKFDVLIHGCNCQHRMGRGFAYSIKSAFPEAYEVDLNTPKDDINKLGTISIANVVRNVYINNIFYKHYITIVNAYTQMYFGAMHNTLNYDALRNIFKKIKILYPNSRIGYPLIGAGLGKGDWSIISKIIDEELLGLDHTLVVLDIGVLNV